MRRTLRVCFCWCFLISGLSWLTPIPALAAKPDAEEFTALLPASAATPIPPPRGASRARLAKNETTGEMALHAKTAQDAIAAAIRQRTAGCQSIRFGHHGFGWVATGMASYAVAGQQPVSIHQTKRETHFKAFTDARAHLHRCLQALTPEAQHRITTILEQNDAIRLALVNLATNDQERHEQALDILARGFVAYAVEDDVAVQALRVHLVATPKTATRLTRPTASAMEATSLREGLRQTQIEVESGLIPPVGNRLIVVNATGELALVGYAVDVISVPPESVARDQSRTAVEKTAVARATAALMGLAAGNNADWQDGLSEANRGEIRAAASGYQDAEPSASRFGQIRDLIMVAVKDDPGLQALRENRLPLAVAIKRFGGEDTVAVMMSYAPSVKRCASPPAQSTTPLAMPSSESPAPSPESAPPTPPSEPTLPEGR
ncbi:MAG: hypothetical protein RKO25_13565 [Candidatus Contendobacter sp.]|nr:hypothetical protein [Candidatus Contendobacter sp.]